MTQLTIPLPEQLRLEALVVRTLKLFGANLPLRVRTVARYLRASEELIGQTLDDLASRNRCARVERETGAVYCMPRDAARWT